MLRSIDIFGIAVFAGWLLLVVQVIWPRSIRTPHRTTTPLGRIMRREDRVAAWLSPYQRTLFNNGERVKSGTTRDYHSAVGIYNNFIAR